MSNIVTWAGHQFTAYPPTTTWNHVSGIYIFARQSSPGNWQALYIGQAQSFADRLPSHERWSEAARHGATHIHALIVPQQVNRDAIEQTLIRACQPVLNTQHR